MAEEMADELTEVPREASEPQATPDRPLADDEPRPRSSNGSAAPGDAPFPGATPNV
jgi:hypothetical protein